MTIDEIVEYVLKTPLNTNRAILTAMLEELQAGGGEPGEPDTPDVPTGPIIYEGGII